MVKSLLPRGSMPSFNLAELQMTCRDKVSVQTDEVRVRQMMLDVGAEVIWKFHTHVAGPYELQTI